MKIDINRQNYSNSQFKSTRTHIVNDMGKVTNCHYTNFNREDVNWGKAVKMLFERFKDFDKIKINLMGCSDGSEAYTLRLYIMKLMGKQASEKVDIFASDLSKDVIDNAKKGKILLHQNDLKFLNSMFARHLFIRDYNTPIETQRGVEFYPYIVKSELRNTINFSVKDVRDESKKHNFSNEIFAFRNGWTFNTLEEQNNIVKNLYKNSNRKTLCWIGQSDLFKSNANTCFQQNGFRGIESDIYTKAETDYPSDTVGIPKEKTNYPEFILFEKK